MTFSEQDKQLILDQYVEWVNNVSDDLEDKSTFSVKEIVYKIIEIIEKEI